MVVREIGKSVRISLNAVVLEGDLSLPRGAGGIIVFSHGSGSSRHSPRNRFVAKEFRDAGFGTLLVDLLTVEEDKAHEMRFNVDLLTGRLEEITRWLKEQDQTSSLSVGFFGGSTGAAAALSAAAHLGQEIKAVVSRGGRPDLADPFLKSVEAPTLLIVGGYDYSVLELNRQAYDQLTCEKEFFIIPEATHLFEEPGALEEVARLSSQWFLRFFPPQRP